MAAFITEPTVRSIDVSALGAGDFQFASAPLTKGGILSVLGLALGTLHPGTPLFKPFCTLESQNRVVKDFRV